MTADPRLSKSARHAYSHIRAQVLNGHFQPGDRLTEQQLADQIGTSRTPVREALRLMVAEGMLRFRPNFGTFVAPFDTKEVRQVFDLRLLLETEVAGLAAQRITPQQIAQLRRIQDQIEAETARRHRPNFDSLAASNREFHQLIGLASGNARIVAMLANAIEMPIVQQTFRRYSNTQLRRSFGHHRELIDALEASDGPWARAVMTCHIRAAEHAFLGGAAVDDAQEAREAAR